MRDDEFDVGYWLLDDEIIDCDGRRCGRVDDVELEGGPGEATRITAIITGPGAFPDRLPKRFSGLGKRLFGDRVVRVPWSAIEDVDVVVRLKQKGAGLQLGRGDDAAGRWINRLPGA
jgi:sporulation protein YlmC with PRC-barrel domain